MKYLLMNKNTEVALLEFNEEKNNIDKVYKIINLDYAPLSFVNNIKNSSANEVELLNKWYKGRGIPSWRKDIENLLEKLNIVSTDELLNKAYGLSLSDQYWFKEEKQKNLNWQDINFFTNDFKYRGYLEASFSSSLNKEKIDLCSPNNTTDGMLQKAWIIENGKRVLVKGTFSPSRQEPINEWLASQICEKLGFDYCNYVIDIIDNKIVSKCENFVGENEEIITAEDIFLSEKISNNDNDISHYTKLLERNGIKNAREKVEDMFLVDYLILNFDRHLRNFGIIRNVETLKWEKVTPIFDSGESMECDKLTNEINFSDRNGKFFRNTDKKFSTILKYIDLSRYDLKKLDGIVEEYEEKLRKYQEYTDITEERIQKLTIGLRKRINNIINIKKRMEY